MAIIRICLVYIDMKKLYSHLVPALILALAAGCATPGSRIKENKALFETYPPEIQEQIKKGQVKPGFTKAMVSMALGKADRVYERSTLQGTSEIWSYVDFETLPERQEVEGRFRVRDFQGGYQMVEDRIWVQVDRFHEFESTRIEFRDGRVLSVEEVTR